jgi:hypothetical protein
LPKQAIDIGASRIEPKEIIINNNLQKLNADSETEEESKVSISSESL